MRFTSVSNLVGVLLALAFTATVRAQGTTDDSGNLETMPSIVTTTGATVILPTGITQAPGPVIPSGTGPLDTNSTGPTSTSGTSTATNSTSTGTQTSASSSSSSSSTTGAGVRSFDSTGIVVAGVLIFTGAGALLQL